MHWTSFTREWPESSYIHNIHVSFLSFALLISLSLHLDTDGLPKGSTGWICCIRHDHDLSYVEGVAKRGDGFLVHQPHAPPQRGSANSSRIPARRACEPSGGCRWEQLHHTSSSPYLEALAAAFTHVARDPFFWK